MRVHHLNCISACALGGALIDGRSFASVRARLVSHCLLVEAGGKLVLIDTGYGLRDVADPKSRLSKFFLALMHPDLRESMTAIRQIERLGFDPSDVTNIVLTHLDFDHAGGLDDFPRARVHMLERERTAAEQRVTRLDRMRYRPQQWSTRANWQVYTSGEGEPWFGFDCVRDIVGLDAEILLVPLIGHTFGHAGVAVKADRRWLLLAGDAYFYRNELDWSRPRCTPGLLLYQTMMEKDRKVRRWNQQRLRELRHDRRDEATIFSSHDPVEFESLAGRRFAEPIAPIAAGAAAAVKGSAAADPRPGLEQG